MSKTGIYEPALLLKPSLKKDRIHTGRDKNFFKNHSAGRDETLKHDLELSYQREMERITQQEITEAERENEARNQAMLEVIDNRDYRWTAHPGVPPLKGVRSKSPYGRGELDATVEDQMRRLQEEGEDEFRRKADTCCTDPL